MMFVDIIVTCMTVSITSVWARGGTGKFSPEADIVERIYPSESLDFYLKFYIQYFSVSGLEYAANGKNNSRTVSICKNIEPFFNNATVLGEFPCPMEKDPDDFGYCCGENSYEHCCKLEDTVNFKIMVGYIVGGVVALVFIIIICIVLHVSKKKSSIKRKKSGERQMSEMGIPKYDSVKTRHLTAKQSDDGYHIFIHFKGKVYYNEFWNELYNLYPDLAWRITCSDAGVEVKEGKLTQSDGSWVSLVLNDDVDGHAVMVVSREKAAVTWMEGPFLDLLDRVPDTAGCLCCTNKKTYPRHPTNGKDQNGSYSQEGGIELEQNFHSETNVDEDVNGQEDEKY